MERSENARKIQTSRVKKSVGFGCGVGGFSGGIGGRSGTGAAETVI